MHQVGFLHTFIIWATHAYGDLTPNLLGAIRFRVRVQRPSNPTSPGLLKRQKECKRELGSTPTLLPPHLSRLGHPYMWGPELKDQVTFRLMFNTTVLRVKILQLRDSRTAKA